MSAMMRIEQWLVGHQIQALSALLRRIRATLNEYSAAQADRRATQALTMVMEATAQTRGREESLGRILTSAAAALEAKSGSIHIVDPGGGVLRLVHAVGVERLDLLTTIPIDDAMVRSTNMAEEVALFGPSDWTTPWTALLREDASAVGLVRLGSQSKPRGLLALAWRTSSQAAANLPALERIAQRALQVLANHDELEQRAADFQAVHAALNWHEALGRTAAHDLRNRLMITAGLLDMAADESSPADAMPMLVQEAVGQIQVAAAMLGDLQEPDRPLAIELVSVEEMVELAVGMAARLGVGDQVAFKLDVPPGLPPIWADRVGLLRVFDNLLSNAVRHNPDVERLNVWLRVTRASDEVMGFEVGDDGAGIPAEAQAVLFEDGPLANGHRRLGLWSSRHLVHAMGGQIWVESKAGDGARFFFTLPAALPEVEA